jgi:hypothetical protein
MTSGLAARKELLEREKGGPADFFVRRKDEYEGRKSG